MKVVERMMKRISLLSVIPLILVPLFSKPGREQPNQITTNLSGVWKVSGGYDNGKDVCIKQDGNKIKSDFIYGDYCYRPDLDIPSMGINSSGEAIGDPRGFFLSGTLKDSTIEGTISACTRFKKLLDDCGLPLAYTADFNEVVVGRDSIAIKYRVDYVKHGEDKFGTWTNCQVLPHQGEYVTVNLTRRQPCNVQAACGYRVTRDEIKRAVEEECGKRRIQLPSYWEHVIENVIEPSLSPNGTGIILPLEQYPILMVAGVKVDPCKAAGERAVQVELFLVEMKKVNGAWQRGKIIQHIPLAGSGDFSPQGLNQAIGQMLDTANLDQYRKGSSS